LPALPGVCYTRFAGKGAMGTPKTNGRIGRLTRAQARAIFDRTARRALRMSGAEFLRKWEAGEFKDPDSNPNVMEVAMLLPLGR